MPMMPIFLLTMYEALASLKRNSHAIELDWQGHSPKCKTYIGHIYYWQQKQRELELSKEPTDKTNTMVWDKLYKWDLNSLNHRGYQNNHKSIFILMEAKLETMLVLAL